MPVLSEDNTLAIIGYGGIKYGTPEISGKHRNKLRIRFRNFP